MLLKRHYYSLKTMRDHKLTDFSMFNVLIPAPALPPSWINGSVLFLDHKQDVMEIVVYWKVSCKVSVLSRAFKVRLIIIWLSKKERYMKLTVCLSLSGFFKKKVYQLAELCYHSCVPHFHFIVLKGDSWCLVAVKL